MFVDLTDQIGPIVHGDHRLVVQRGIDVLVIGFRVFTPDSMHRYGIVFNQCSSDIILGTEGITGTKYQVRASCLQRACEISGFSCNVQTTAHTQTLEWLRLAETCG